MVGDLLVKGRLLAQRRKSTGFEYVDTAEDEVQLAQTTITLAAEDTLYRVPFTLPTAMKDANWRVSRVVCDQTALIREDLCNKTTTVGALLITVPTGTAAGTYGSNLQLQVTVYLKGRWTAGASAAAVAAVWGSPA